jgi:hypothetical protein
METLFETISRRRRPEDVAQMIMETLGDALTPDERRILNHAAAGSLKRASWTGWTQVRALLSELSCLTF